MLGRVALYPLNPCTQEKAPRATPTSDPVPVHTTVTRKHNSAGSAPRRAAAPPRSEASHRAYNCHAQTLPQRARAVRPSPDCLLRAWHGGPPSISSTSPGSGNTAPVLNLSPFRYARAAASCAGVSPSSFTVEKSSSSAPDSQMRQRTQGSGLLGFVEEI